MLWKQTIDINLFGTYLLSKHFLALLMRSERKKIINFSGGGAFGTFPNYSAYAVSKAAVVRFSENIAHELKDHGVNVNCIAPGFVATEIHEATLVAGENATGRDHFHLTKEKLQEGAVSMEIPVECVKFLISPDSDGLSGKTISAGFDKWNTEGFKQAVKEITASELYSMRRVNLTSLDDQDGLKQTLEKL
jgi:3-oxoacyl-[acyl-carrier protein] reductase